VIGVAVADGVNAVRAAASVDSLSVALPATIVIVPSCVVPSKKVTVPVAAIVAVNVTWVPDATDRFYDVRPTVVATRTFSLTATDVLVPSSHSPE
jgi:hypothetical protein